MADNVPLTHLLDLERRCRRYAHPLPGDYEIKQRWLGVGFRLADLYIASELGEIREILDYPIVTKLPNSKAWFHGVANIRGALVPVIDLQAFLGLESVIPGRRSKILRIQMGAVQAGLLAPEIYGIKRFLLEDMHKVSPTEYHGEMAEFMLSKFMAAGERWSVFSMRQLSEDPKFFQILK